MTSAAKKKRNQKNRHGFSLMELLVVIGIIAVLAGLSMPMIKAMQKSYNSTGTESMISAALSTARTLAISNHTYAGVRFQKAGAVNNVFDADQYMIFIIYGGHDVTTWDCGFFAVEGYKPMKLPSNIGVIDKIKRRGTTQKDCGSTIEEDFLAVEDWINPVHMTDASAFSVIFSPAGRLVIYKMRCRQTTKSPYKVDVFNTQSDVESDDPNGMFIEDNHDDYGIGVENSRRELYIYDREKFKTMKTASQRFEYLESLEAVYINSYTGEIIKN